MRRFKRLGTFTLLVLLTRLQAQPLEKTVTTADGVTFYLPADWASIPKSVLDQYFANSGQLSSARVRPQFDLLFKRMPSRDGTGYPHIAVQFKRTGRIPESEMRKLHQIKMSTGVEQISEQSRPLLSYLKEGGTLYEEESHTVWDTVPTQEECAGDVSSLSALRLTEFGYVQMNGFCRRADAERDLPEIEAIIRGAEMDETIRYRTRTSDGLTMNIMGDGGRVGFAFMIIIGVTMAMILHKSQKPPKLEL